MRKKNSNKWHQIQKGKTQPGSKDSPPLKRQNSEKILREITHDAQCSMGPVQRDQVFSKDIALGITRIFDYFAQFHVVKHLQPQPLIGADGFVHAAPDHVESTDTHVIPRLRVRYFPWPVTEHEKRLKERDHHLLARFLHDHSREHDHMVGLLGFRICEGTTHRIW